MYCSLLLLLCAEFTIMLHKQETNKFKIHFTTFLLFKANMKMKYYSDFA